jgi:hypothetical protein
VMSNHQSRNAELRDSTQGIWRSDFVKPGVQI